jgi:hypothetical protein
LKSINITGYFPCNYEAGVGLPATIIVLFIILSFFEFDDEKMLRLIYFCSGSFSSIDKNLLSISKFVDLPHLGGIVSRIA